MSWRNYMIENQYAIDDTISIMQSYLMSSVKECKRIRNINHRNLKNIFNDILRECRTVEIYDEYLWSNDDLWGNGGNVLINEILESNTPYVECGEVYKYTNWDKRTARREVFETLGYFNNELFKNILGNNHLIEY